MYLNSPMDLESLSKLVGRLPRGASVEWKQIDKDCSVGKRHLAGNILLQYQRNVARLLLVTVTDYQKVGGSDRRENCRHLVVESSDRAKDFDRPTQ